MPHAGINVPEVPWAFRGDEEDVQCEEFYDDTTYDWWKDSQLERSEDNGQEDKSSQSD